MTVDGYAAPPDLLSKMQDFLFGLSLQGFHPGDFGAQFAQLEALVSGLKSSAELDVAAIVKKAVPGVAGLLITVRQNGLTSYVQGSGIIVSEGGQTLTNRHVIEGMIKGLAFLNDGRVLPVRFWTSDADVDLA